MAGRPKNMENMYNKRVDTRQFSEGQKSKGILDDYAVRKVVDSNEGTVQHTPTNAKDLVNKEYVDGIAINSDITLYLNNTASDIATYYVLAPTVQTDTESSAGAVLATDDTLIKAFASAVGCECVTNLALLVSGTYETHFHAGSDKTGTRIYAELYKRTGGGSETLLSTSEESNLITIAKASYTIHFVVTEDINWLSTDRIVIKYYGNPGTPANPTTTIYMEGDTASRLTLQTTSFSRLHNQLGNLEWENAGHPSVFSGAGVTTAGTISGGYLYGDTISGGTLYGDGSNLTGIAASGGSNWFSNATVLSPLNPDQMISGSNLVISDTISGGDIIGTTVSGGTLYGDGSNITGLAAGGAWLSSATVLEPIKPSHMVSAASLIIANTISGANIANIGDRTGALSGAALTTNIIWGTGATPPTATDHVEGTIYVQYTA